MSDFPKLLGDVGGTNVRLALQVALGAPVTHTVNLACADYPGPLQAILHYLERVLPQAGCGVPRTGVIGIANPIVGDEVQMTNAHWAFSIDRLRDALGLRHLRFINDFTALALSLPALQGHERVQVGGGEPVPGKAMALVGAGTGLGVSGLIPVGPDRWVPLEGEGGHVTLPAWDADEAQLIEVMRHQHPHVSAERALSGPGLVALYQAHATLRGLVPEALSPADVSQRGLDGRCPLCLAALDSFCAMLGTVAADLALTLGARGGVYVGGGIVPRLGAHFGRSPFRARFEAKGRFGPYLQRIPVYVIQAPFSALIGASRA